MSYWWTTSAQRQVEPLRGEVNADIAIVGAGYTGLWTSLALLDREPWLRVAICERESVGFGGSGRNGGFLEPSLTHGLANGVRHFSDEVGELERLADQSYEGFRAFLKAHRVDCDFEPTGMLDVAVDDWQVDELREQAELHQRFGHAAELLDADDVSEHLASPRFLAGLHRPAAGGVLNPAKLAGELARVAQEQGAQIYERTPVLRISPARAGVVIEAAGGTVRAERAVLATNAYSGELLRRTRRHFVPVWDYILVSAQLTERQLDAIGWKRRQGVSDAGNQFHYFRLTADNRILWGGYDALYHFGSRPGERASPATWAKLEEHFRATFPQLSDLEFEWRWGGAIATTTRFTPVFGDALGGRVVYALGYTGLGVAATRFAGRVLADRLLDPASPLLQLRYVTSSPFPFPPEPLRWAGVALVRRALARADRRQGARGPVLQVLDRFGIGFDS
ncbi:MAG TPA: FAD-dependent oxidoreductase [Egibacteraceae bacterium]|nr:FAD-dependent oxidoreductase [Egibacteraceae bacterium]